MNRQRFAEHGLVQVFFDALVRQAVLEGYVSDQHFRVDGTLIRSWASLKSLRPKAASPPPEPPDDPGNPTVNPDYRDGVNFHGQRRTHATHISRTDPEARLARKGAGKEAHLGHSAHVLMENRHGLCVAATVEAADGPAQRRAARALIARVKRRHRLHPRTLGLDSGYDDGQFLARLERAGVLPHVPLRRGRIVAQDAAGQAPASGAAADAAEALGARRSANGCANASKRSSAGARRSDGWRGPDWSDGGRSRRKCC